MTPTGRIYETTLTDGATVYTEAPPAWLPAMTYQVTAHRWTYYQEDGPMTIKITLTEGQSAPAGRVAEAELHFTEGPLQGLKLIGFSVWERRGGSGLNVTFPARSYTVNGDRRSFALLRPIMDPTAQTPIREAIIEAYQRATAPQADPDELSQAQQADQPALKF